MHVDTTLMADHREVLSYLLTATASRQLLITTILAIPAPIARRDVAEIGGRVARRRHVVRGPYRRAVLCPLRAAVVDDIALSLPA